MATLDVSEVLRDPMFTSKVTLVPKAESFDENGDPVYIDSDWWTIDAVVTNDNRAIRRQAESSQLIGTICVRFTCPDAYGFIAKGYDGVIWMGRSFVIIEESVHAQFGEGHVKLICTPSQTEYKVREKNTSLLRESGAGLAIIGSNGERIYIQTEGSDD